MFLSILRLSLAFLLLATTVAPAGITSYADQGQTDFDTAIQSLNPYGTWSKIDGTWAWTPFGNEVPYTNGRWLYTEYGWYWKGNLPTSWATEHYGYWKCGADKKWSWYPLPDWLPQIVEIRVTPDYVGWRSAAVDSDGSFIESPSERFAKVDEWTFVTRQQFAGPITPAILAKPDVRAQQLDDSTDSSHSYQTYRAIDRPGPHPADFVAFSKDGGMFPSHTLADQLATQPPPPSTIIPGLTPGIAGVKAKAAPDDDTVPQPKLSQDPDDANSEPADPRQVKYWVTMSLPSLWSKPPAEAKAEEIYIYRPDFLQDQDGVNRRISLWVDPKARTATNLDAVLAGSAAPDADAKTPAPAPKAQDPFRGQLDNSFHGEEPPATPARPVGASTTNAAPSGRAQ